MSNFLVRVELSGASSGHYDILYTQLAAVGIVDVVSMNDNSRLRLPTGLYYCISPLNRDTILNAAKSAAARTGRPYEVVVGEVPDGFTSFGLQVA